MTHMPRSIALQANTTSWTQAQPPWDTVRGRDANGVQDIAFFLQANNTRLLLARTGASRPAANPSTSPHGNYVVFDRGGQVWLNYIGAK